jgi:hypothetical protein
VLLETPQVVDRSKAHVRLLRDLCEAGLSLPLALEIATTLLVWVLVASRGAEVTPPATHGEPILLAVDSGSRGVTLRAGSEMSTLIRAAHDPSAPTPAVIQGDRVIVRRLRGGRQGQLELNPGYEWRFKIQAPTWNTVLELAGLDVREIKVDSGAARLDCALPPPRAVVPIEISSGVVGVRLRRPPGVAVVAHVHTGVLQIRLNGRNIPATASDVHWQSGPDASSRDHYQLTIHSGSARVTLEEDTSIRSTPAPQSTPAAPAGLLAALNVVLDGVAAQSR